MKNKRVIPYAPLAVCCAVLMMSLAYNIFCKQWIRIFADMAYIIIVVTSWGVANVAVRWRQLARKQSEANINAIAQLRNLQREAGNLMDECASLRVRVTTLARTNADLTKQKDRVDREFLKVCKENRHLEAELKRKNYN